MTTPDPRSTTTTDPEAAAFAGMYGGGMYGGMYPGMFGDYGGYYDGEDENEQVQYMSFAAKKKENDSHRFYSSNFQKNNELRK